jgi:hypothetical protein
LDLDTIAVLSREGGEWPEKVANQKARGLAVEGKKVKR